MDERYEIITQMGRGRFYISPNIRKQKIQEDKYVKSRTIH